MIVKDIRGVEYKVKRNSSKMNHCGDGLCDANYYDRYCATQNSDCKAYEYMKLLDNKKRVKFGEVIKLGKVSLVVTKGTCKECYCYKENSNTICQLRNRYCNGRSLCLKYFKGGI